MACDILAQSFFIKLKFAMRKTFFSWVPSVVIAAVFLVACDQSPEVTVSSAENAWNSGDYRSAIIQLKTVLQSEPDNARARWLISQVYLDLGDGASAEKELRRAKALGVDDNSFLPAMAHALWVQGKFSDVLELERTPGLAEVPLAELNAIRALAYLASDSLDDAAESMELAVRGAPNSPIVGLARARYLVMRDDFAEARTVINELLSTNSKNGPAWSLLAKVQSELGEYKESEESYTNAITYRADNLKDIIGRSFVRIALNDDEGAWTDVNRLLQIAPKSTQVQYLSGLLSFRARDYQKARDAFEVSYGLDPYVFETNVALAKTYVNLGKDSLAEEAALRVVTRKPTFIPTRKLLAILYLKQKKGREAELLVAPIVQQSPEDYEAKSILASSLMLQGKVARAEELLRLLSKEHPNDPGTHLRHGMSLLALGERKSGNEVVESATRLASSEEEINRKAVLGLLQYGEQQSALSIAQSYEKNNPTDPNAAVYMGTALLGTGDTDAAITSFIDALRRDPGNPVASVNLARLALRDRRFDDARQYVSLALEQAPNSPQLMYQLALVENAGGNSRRAIEILEGIVETEPGFDAPRTALADLLIQVDQPEAALRVLSGLGSDSPQSLFIKGQALFHQNRLADAEAVIEQLLSSTPNSVEGLLLLAEIHGRQGDMEALKAVTERLAELAPERQKVALLRARILIADGDYDAARGWLDTVNPEARSSEFLRTELMLAQREGAQRKALDVARQLFEVDPSAESLSDLTVMLMMTGNAEEAKSRLRDWTLAHPDDVETALSLASILADSGDSQSAIAVLQRIVDRGIESTTVLNNLAWFQRESNPKVALEFAEKANELSPNNLAVLDTYAELLARNGRIAAAISAINKAVVLSGDDPVMRIRRAEILNQTGDREKAINELDKLINTQASPEIVKHALMLREDWQNGAKQ